MSNGSGVAGVVGGAQDPRPSAPLRGTLAPLSGLVEAPGYGARRLQQAYLAAWSRHVDPVLTGPQFAVMWVVREYPDADQGSLAAAVTLDSSTMADVCRRLEKRGLIARRESPRDARAKVLTLTDEGAATLDQMMQRARALDEALLSAYQGGQLGQVAALLNSLADHWEAVAERPEL